jgi:hypothetical protein
MSDLVKKYQHYFNESVKLQETVNEQLAYITELEDAIIALDEVYRMTPERDAILKREKNKAQKDIDDSLESTYELSKLNNEEEMAEDEGRKLAAASARKGRIELLRMKTEPLEKREFGDHPDLLVKYFPDELPNRNRALSDSSLNKDLKVRRRIEKINNKTVKEEAVLEATKADDEHGTVARVGRITKFLEKHTDVNKMKAHHFNTFFDHPDYFGETDEASDKAMKKLPVHHRKQIRAMRKDYDDLNW